MDAIQSSHKSANQGSLWFLLHERIFRCWGHGKEKESIVQMLLNLADTQLPDHPLGTTVSKCIAFSAQLFPKWIKQALPQVKETVSNTNKGKGQGGKWMKNDKNDNKRLQEGRKIAPTNITSSKPLFKEQFGLDCMTAWKFAQNPCH